MLRSRVIRSGVPLEESRRQRAGRRKESPPVRLRRLGCAAVGCGGRGGFTLMELVITMGIISVLLSITVPLMGGAREMARSFRCQMTLRGVAADFGLYADEQLHDWRGRDEGLNKRFTLESFIDSQYGAREFWRHGDWGNSPSTWPRFDEKSDPLRCASVDGVVALRPETRCVSGAIDTPTTVSFGFNMRLHKTTHGPGGLTGLFTAKLRTSVLEHAMVPLVWDVDGHEALALRSRPVLSAPALSDDPSDPYSSGRFWFPGKRHSGSMNVAFLDQHVATTSKPLEEPTWDWAFDPGM